MPRTFTGTLLKCDPIAKQIVLMLNERHNNTIVLEDLDAHHLFVHNKPEILDLIKKTVDKELEEAKKPKSIANVSNVDFKRSSWNKK